MFNPNGSSSVTVELDTLGSMGGGTNNIYFKALQAMPDMRRALG